jgi:hypothetical protein
LDFKKAFNRIEWGFLFTALSKLEFHDMWVKWICSLYNSASSAIKVNREVGSDFQLARSVRQGCPLAPYLFILATDVLGHMIEDPNYGVEGLTLPKGGCVRDQTFVDDTALYLQGSHSNMDRAQNILKLFCKAFDAKINWNKPAAIWASKKKKTWEWGQEVGLRWVPKGEGIYYFGVQVSFRLPTKANFDKMMLVLKRKLIN